MKLKKNIYKTNKLVNEKFTNCLPTQLGKGDYIRLNFLAFNQKRRGGNNFRIGTRTVILFKQRRKGNSLSFVVISLYKHEKVKIRYSISSPYMMLVSFIKKSMNLSRMAKSKI